MVELDIADDNSGQNAVQSILSTAGHIAVVINNADFGTMDAGIVQLGSGAYRIRGEHIWSVAANHAVLPQI